MTQDNSAGGVWIERAVTAQYNAKYQNTWTCTTLQVRTVESPNLGSNGIPPYDNDSAWLDVRTLFYFFFYLQKCLFLEKFYFIISGVSMFIGLKNHRNHHFLTMWIFIVVWYMYVYTWIYVDI